MATLQSVCQLTKVNTTAYFLAILLAFFLNIVTAGQAFPDGGHGGDPVSRANSVLPVQCLPHSALHARLTALGKVPVASGITIQNNIIGVLYVHPEKHTWTWVGRWSVDKSCVVAAGENWREAPTSKVGRAS